MYENDDLFESDASKYCLPSTVFLVDEDKGLAKLRRRKFEILTAYPFSVCNELEDKKEFGDANFLFEAIDNHSTQKLKKQ